MIPKLALKTIMTKNFAGLKHDGQRRRSKESHCIQGCSGLGAVSRLEVGGQNVRDQKTEGFALELNEKKYPVEKAKGRAEKYTKY